MKLYEQLVGELQNNNAGLSLGDHFHTPCCRLAAPNCWQ